MFEAFTVNVRENLAENSACKFHSVEYTFRDLVELRAPPFQFQFIYIRGTHTFSKVDTRHLENKKFLPPSSRGVRLIVPAVKPPRTYDAVVKY